MTTSRDAATPAAISCDSARRSELIAVADEHQGRTLDGGQERPRIRARHDRLLLAQEGLRSGFLGHAAHALAQRFVALPVAMDEYRKL